MPSSSESWRWGFYSGNGSYSPQPPGEDGVLQPMWRDILSTHMEKPFHVMVGGGDQVCNDDVWGAPSLAQVRERTSLQGVQIDFQS